MSQRRRHLTWALAGWYAAVSLLVGGGHHFLHRHGHDQDVAGADGCLAQSEAMPQNVGGSGLRWASAPGTHRSAPDAHDHDLPDDAALAHDHSHSGHSPATPAKDEDGCAICRFLASKSLPAQLEAPPAMPQWCRPVYLCVPSRAAATFVPSHPPRGPPLPA